MILLVWVDDLIIAASNNTLLSDVKEMLKRRFKMKDMGVWLVCLCDEVVHSQHPIPQTHSTDNLLLTSIDLPLVDISYKWDHTVCGLLCLASFI